jgi:hypothetical protein
MSNDAAAEVGEDSPLVRGATPPNTLLAARFAGLLARWFPDSYGIHASVTESWSYFERYTLPRRMLINEEDGTYRKAPPGTERSTLYPAWTTPQSELKDFGTGVAVYFETLRALTLICLVAGLLYVPSIVYYGSDGYTSKQIHTMTASLRGSMICPEPTWVPCPECTEEEWNESPRRFGLGAGGLVFVLKNTCAPLHWGQGINHLVVMAFLTVSMFALGFYQRRLELHYDESVLTAADFSIQVDNPPADAVNAEEWKDFFQQFGDVAYVTVALNNSDLLKALTRRRVLLQKAYYKLEHRQALTMALQEIPPSLEEKKPILYKKLMAIDAKCRELLKQKFPTSAIFITFQKERAQRLALQTLEVGQINVVNNCTDVLETKQCFRGNLVLDILEAPEPSAIRWQDLDETNLLKFGQRVFTASLSFCVILIGFWLVDKAYATGNIGLAATEITVMNILMPHVFKFINSFEAHQSEDGYQASLYWKIAIFRWVNTGIVTILIKPFTDTVSDAPGSLIASVHAVLRAEIMIAPVIQMLDVKGIIQRQLLAPVAMNQTAMISFFRGGKQSLGEKYTNATKTIFLVFFYSAIFPSGFFYGAIALQLSYVTDKFLLLRSWGATPRIGDAVARLSRKIFFPLTLVFLAVMSEFFYSSYPCDNLCDTESVVSQGNRVEYIGKHNVTTNDEHTEWKTQVLVEEGDSVYRYCNQDFLQHLQKLLDVFVQEKGDWMTDDQLSMSYVFGLFAALVISIMVFINVSTDVTEAKAEALGGYVSVNGRPVKDIVCYVFSQSCLSRPTDDRRA